ncbi:MAG TPA: uroporphyrinogen-III C-methyltransferase, partial [Polyangiaceae bacterium]
MSTSQIGKVWLVGAGPGDPGLITVYGREVLQAAEAVLYDALAHPALLELCPGAELHDVGKRYAQDSPSQESTTRLLIQLAQSGKRVVRLKGGDPLLFARGAEEALALAEAGIPFEIVPGISSPVAAGTYAGISLTHRDLSSSVTFITGSDRKGKEWSQESWRKLATATDTICVLMGTRRIREIAAALIEGGRPPSTPVAVVQWAARAEQRVVIAELDGIAKAVIQAGIANPSVVIVGEVVRLREKLRWYDTRPLFGKRILALRPEEQSANTEDAIRRRGAQALIFPIIEIRGPPDLEPVQRAALKLEGYDWVLFTSATGVTHFIRVLEQLGLDARAFKSAKVAVIGPKTAEVLRRCGIRADLVAGEAVGESLAASLLQAAPLKRVLLLRARIGRPELPEALRRAGVNVDVVATYETRPTAGERARRLVELFEQAKVDVVLFTASSTVRALVDLLGDRAPELLSAVTLGAIGPVTAQSCRDSGL